MTLLAERVRRDLAEIADRATPSPSAWESIRARIDSLAEESRMKVIVLEAETDEGSDRPGRTRRTRTATLAVAAAVLVAAVLSIGLFVASNSDDETSETATEAPAEPGPESDAALVADFVLALHGGDTEATIAVMDPEAIVKYWSATSTADIPGLHGQMAARDLVVSADECVEQTDAASSGALAGARKFECPSTFVEAVSVAKGLDPYDAAVDVWVQDSEVVLLRLDFDRFDRYEPEHASFFAWLDETYPFWFEVMLTNGFDSGSDESNALWEQYTAEYIAEELN